MQLPAAETETSNPSDVQPEVLVWLDPADLHFRDPGIGKPITLTISGDRSHRNIFALRAFPRHHPESYVQIFDGKDGGGRGDMIGMIRELYSLTPENRAVVDEALRRSYLVPRVLGILDLEESRYMSRWVVETDRGVKTFDMRQPHRNVIVTGSGRVIMIDVEENRYEIIDIEDLDNTSRSFLERVM